MSVLAPWLGDIEHWMRRDASSQGVLRSRLRLYRNLPRVFSSAGLLDEIRETVSEHPSMKEAHFLSLEEMSAADRQYLLERGHLEPREAEEPQGLGIFLFPEADRSIVIASEDHLRLQCLSPGLSISAAYALVDNLESSLEDRIDFAFSETFGYLSPNPSRAGTGMKATVSLFLPALTSGSELPAILRGLQAIRMDLSGFQGEASGLQGSFFQLGNAKTLGRSEEEVLGLLERTAGNLLKFEMQARGKLQREAWTLLEDQVGKAIGKLDTASSLNLSDSLAALGTLMLGRESGLPDLPEMQNLRKAWVLSHPGHLQMIDEEASNPLARKEIRAKCIRMWMREQAEAKEGPPV
ncbi:MAG: hypothetical protein QF492_02940 [Candidatus Krumholzibacteria bacterium]|nr:hypothetical protein [Candidatus Krumholzibacteria bacterium]MDP6796419.1 hypothetical protein [Candidatus Krumholzibacteria bacterium]MDP7020808.1 hypothetical protein [Candidatus Krumholzibacteria bacterium]